MTTHIDATTPEKLDHLIGSLEAAVTSPYLGSDAYLRAREYRLAIGIPDRQNPAEQEQYDRRIMDGIAADCAEYGCD